MARSCFRKHLILKELQRPVDASNALAEARTYREALIGHENCGNDVMAEYDSLVSYYNK